MICDIGLFVCYCISSSDWKWQVCKLQEIIFSFDWFIDKMCVTWLWHLMDRVFSLIHSIFRMLVESGFLMVRSWSYILGLSQCLDSKLCWHAFLSVDSSMRSSCAMMVPVPIQLWHTHGVLVLMLKHLAVPGKWQMIL